MSREKFAAGLLVLLIAVSGWNIRKADSLCSKIDAQLQKAENCAQAQDWDNTREALESALDIWLRAEGYTHIFIRHAEIDSCSDVFYDCLSAGLEEEPQELSATISKLRYHLSSIAGMERVSLGNIF